MPLLYIQLELEKATPNKRRIINPSILAKIPMIYNVFY